MNKKIIVTVLIISLWVLPGLAYGQSASVPQSTNEATGSQRPRPVTGQVLTSTSMPAVRLAFDKNFKYVGTQSFVGIGQ